MNPYTGTRTPVLQYGQLSPPPSSKPTMYAPSPQPAPATHAFSRMSPAMTPTHAQISLFRNGPPVASPETIPPSPYQVPSSRPTYMEDDDMHEFLEFKRQKYMRSTNQQQPPHAPMSAAEQQYHYYTQQQPYQRPPPNVFPPAMLPPHVSRPQPQDSGYGTTDDYGPRPQARPPPQQSQQSHTWSTKPGHFYGPITAGGKARVLLGNVEDVVRPGPPVQQHTYSGAHGDGEASIVAGTMDSNSARNYFRPV